MLVTRLAFVATIQLATVGAMAPAGAQDTPARLNAGTLTCTATGLPDVEKRTWSLSCTFEPLDQADKLDLAGRMTDFKARNAPGRTIMVWTVRAPSQDVKSSDLTGQYRITPDSGEDTLIGGKNNVIALDPATRIPDPSGPGQVEIRSLELELPKV